MNVHSRALFAVLACTLAFASPVRAEDAIASESRDAAAAFVGALNFVVGRLGVECLKTLGRPESPKDFALAWRSRNADYYAATTAYITQRIEAAHASGGDQARDTVAREYVVAVRQNGDASVAEWFRSGSRREACRRAIAAVESGALDVNAKAPVFADLKALVAWAKKD